ncbi:hypothetical protein [Bradyrhizobium centrosematis]|uniref:hypothetical protein n=1 Tax=Bradyrhizobium centrosematis TaxID=1300039 RepID=UPI00216A4BDE|nr:hypothetical protein [Bradyrhizobium centrosematis]MCS3765059.1 hypothetical protein [Bradyrhizobium centrosematis]
MKSAARPAIVQPELISAGALVASSAFEENMLRNNFGAINDDLDDAYTSVKGALTAIPSESFLWLLLYTIEETRGGFEISNVKHLSQSYARGPHEGWIALKRNAKALAVFASLDSDQQAVVCREFAELVDSNFSEVSANNLKTVGWAHRERLLTALINVDILSKKKLYNELASDGVKLAIPGVNVDERPWR